MTESKAPPPSALTPADLQRMLGIGRLASYRLAHAIGRRLGARWLVHPDALDAWLRNRDGAK